VFVYDRELNRFLRVTQTGFTAVGFLASPSGDEIAYVTLQQVTLPDDPKAAPPFLASTRIGTVSLASPEVKASKDAEVKNARTLALEYLAGDELIATTYAADGWWGLAAPTAYSIDRATGKARPAKPPAPGGRRLLVRYEGVELEAPGDAEGVAADWSPDAGTAEEFVIDASKKRVQLPRGQAARRATLAWSPDRRRLAFATAADACADKPADRQAALYVVEAESGKLKHVTAAQSSFMPRFLDGVILAFEDDAANVRLYDAAASKEVGRLDSRAGSGLVGLGAQTGLLCTREAPAAGTPVAPAAGAGGAEAGGRPEIMKGD
jgi:hypothetical protein